MLTGWDPTRAQDGCRDSSFGPNLWLRQGRKEKRKLVFEAGSVRKEKDQAGDRAVQALRQQLLFLERALLFLGSFVIFGERFAPGLSAFVTSKLRRGAAAGAGTVSVEAQESDANG
jgi:hypothetical protein